MKRFILVVVCSLLPLANGFYDAQDSGDLAEDGPEPKLREQIQACSNKWLKEHRRGYQFINYMTKGLKEQLASGRRSALPATPLAPAIFPLPRLSHDARTGRGNHAGGETKAKERALTAGPHAGVERSIDGSNE